MSRTLTSDSDTITLKDAAQHFGFSVYTLRTEADRGRLAIYMIGKRYYTTPADIKEMVRQAWSHGYALLFHGSFTRDLDLIAVPWTEAACDPGKLVRLVAESADLNILGKSNSDETKHGSPKEHGRRAWTLTFKGFADPRFIDLSVMPRQTQVPS